MPTETSAAQHQDLRPRGPIVLLDGLRGIAAVLVVCGHMGATAFPNALPVDFFFMLSGYVVARAYEKKFSSGMTFLEFAKIRLIRLYPVIFFGSAMMLAVVLTGVHGVEGNIWLVAPLQFLMIPILESGKDIFRINGVQWSLLFELLANAVHKLLFPWLSEVTLSLLTAISFIALIGVTVIYPTFTLGWWGDNAWVGIPRVACPYFAGILLFRLLRDTGPIRVPASLVLLLFTALALVPNIHPVNGIRLAVLIFAFPIVITLSIGAVASPMIARVCRLLGEISYPLYATHLAVLFSAKALLSRQIEQAPMATNTLIITAALVIAFTVSRLWDQPIRAFLSHRFTPRAVRREVRFD